MYAGSENGWGIWLGIWSAWGSEPDQRIQPETGLEGWGGPGEILKVATKNLKISWIHWYLHIDLWQNPPTQFIIFWFLRWMLYSSFTKTMMVGTPEFSGKKQIAKSFTSIKHLKL